MKDFLNTTLGKFILSLGFAVGTLIVAEVGKFVTDNPDLFSPVVLLVINAILFALKNLFSKEVKNI